MDTVGQNSVQVSEDALKLLLIGAHKLDVFKPLLQKSASSLNPGNTED